MGGIKLNTTMKKSNTPAPLPVPDTLIGDSVALVTWHRITARFKPSAKPHRVNLNDIERYCHYQSVYENARLDVLKNGTSVKAPNGIAYKNPNFAVMTVAQSNLLKLGSAFWHLLDEVVE